MVLIGCRCTQKWIFIRRNVVVSGPASRSSCTTLFSKGLSAHPSCSTRQRNKRLRIRRRRLSLARALRLVPQAIEEGRVVLQGLRSAPTTSMSLEDALSKLGDECTPESTVHFRILVSGHSRAMKPTIQDQIYLIAREALVNALRHSEATSIEAEVEYLPGRLRVAVRDNGRGIDAEVVRSGRRHGHWGMAAMRERAENIGARLKVRSRVPLPVLNRSLGRSIFWSRTAGTEVELSIPSHIAFPKPNPFHHPFRWWPDAPTEK